MTLFATHKKRFLFSDGIKVLTLAVFFAILTPVDVSAAVQSKPSPEQRFCLVDRNGGTACYDLVDQCTANARSLGVDIRQCEVPVAKPKTMTAGEAKTWADADVLVEKRAADARARDKGGRGILPDLLYGLLTLVPVLPILTGIAYIVFKVSSIFLTLMAKIMDFSIGVTISSNLFGSLTFVDIGWTAVRDFANMFFIFALLYIAIQTILGLGGGGTKRWLAHLIIAAILINFSLFATKVVIDSGNVLAVSIWDKIKTQQGPATMSSASSKILGGLDLQTVFENGNVYETYRFDSLIVIYAGGAIFMFIAGYVLLAAALMMITRTIMLIVLMIFSPFAFMAFGLPKLEQYGQKWLDKLIKQTFVAPFFIFMLYLNSKMVDNFDIFRISQSKGTDFAGAFVGHGDFQIIFNFIVMIGFLIASIAIANNFAGDVGSHARGWAKSASKWAGGMAGGAAVGTGAFAMRQSLGKIGMMGSDNKALHDQAAQAGWRGALARGKLAMYSGMSKATYDPRATKLGKTALSGGGYLDIGEGGGKGGFKATGSALGKLTSGTFGLGYTGTEHDKEVLAIAEERYKNDPAGKEAYLRANLGTVAKKDDKGKVIERFAERYKEDSAFKGARESIDTEKRTKAAKDAVKTEPKAIRDAEAQLAKYKAVGMAANDPRLIEAASNLNKATTKLAEALRGINGKEFGEMVNEKMLNENPELLRHTTRQQLAYLNTNYDKYTPTMMKQANDEIMRNGNDESRQYLIQQAKMKTSMFSTDLTGELKKELAAQSAQRIEFEKEAAANKKEVDTFDELTASDAQITAHRDALKQFEASRIAHYDAAEKLDGRTQDILGALSPKEVARLAPDEIKSDEAMVRNYTVKHFNEIENYHKNIKQDAGAKQKLFADIRENALKRGTAATRKYMEGAMRNSASVYYDPTAQIGTGSAVGSAEIAKKDEALRRATEERIAAKAALDTAKTTSWQAGKLSDAERAHQAAIEQERRAQEELEKIQRRAQTSNNRGGASTPEQSWEEEVDDNDTSVT